RPEYRHPVRPSCSCVAGEGFSVPSVRTSASHKQGTRPPALLLLFAALDASAAGWILVAGTEGRDNQGLLQTGIIKVRQRLGRVLRLGTVTAVLISSGQQLKCQGTILVLFQMCDGFIVFAIRKCHRTAGSGVRRINY